MSSLFWLIEILMLGDLWKPFAFAKELSRVDVSPSSDQNSPESESLVQKMRNTSEWVLRLAQSFPVPRDQLPTGNSGQTVLDALGLNRYFEFQLEIESRKVRVFFKRRKIK